MLDRFQQQQADRAAKYRRWDERNAAYKAEGEKRRLLAEQRKARAAERQTTQEVRGNVVEIVIDASPQRSFSLCSKWWLHALPIQA